MVHDQNKLLSYKVRETETNAASWNKRDVWKRITGELEQPTPSRMPFFAAAAIWLVLILASHTSTGPSTYFIESDLNTSVENLANSPGIAADTSVFSKETKRPVATISRNPKAIQPPQEVIAMDQGNVNTAMDTGLDLATLDSISLDVSREPMAAEANDVIEPILGKRYYDEEAYTPIERKLLKKIHRLDMPQLNVKRKDIKTFSLAGKR